MTASSLHRQKGWSDIVKKARRERGVYSENIEPLSGYQSEYDGESVSVVQPHDSAVGYGSFLPEDTAAGWSSKLKGAKHGSTSTDQDPLVQSISALKIAQETLEKELVKFKEINGEIPNGNSEDLITHAESIRSPRDVESEIVETSDREAEIEIENLFKQKVEAEVEYLAISRSVQRGEAGLIVEHRAVASELDKVVDKHGEADIRAAALHRKEGEKLPNMSEDMERTNRTQERRATASRFVVVFCIVVVIVVIVWWRLLPSYGNLVPT